MEKYIENKEDEMLEKTVAYVKEFLSNPANHNLIDHHASEVANAKIEGIDETKLAIIKRMQAKNYSKKEIMTITKINNSEYDKLLQMS